MKQTLTDQELSIIANIIDVATQKGIFRAADMTTVGELFNKITSMLPKPEAKEDGKK
jgi:hypothetical protein